MCVILYTEINGMKILAKNRDRGYKPSIKIMHEIINGIEVVYIEDDETGWIEGMNENGIGLINSTLDGKDGKKKSLFFSKKRNVMYKILVDSNIKKNEQNILDIIEDTNKKYILEGHTILFFHDDIFHIENNNKNNFIIKKINKTNVFSNHGIILKDEGYIKGIKGLSSYLRREIIKNELMKNKINNIEELLHIMNKNYININQRFQPYRDKKYILSKNNQLKQTDTIVSTTSQLVMNMTNKEFIFYSDINNSKNVKYVNKLPSNYTPKIRVIIKDTEKNMKPEKIFNEKYLKKIYKKYDYNAKPSKYTKHTKRVKNTKHTKHTKQIKTMKNIKSIKKNKTCRKI